MKRIAFNILCILSLFILPWWVSIPLFLLGIFLFPSFYEGLVFGILMYGMYAVGGAGIFSSKIWFPCVLAAIFFSAYGLKSKLRLYS